MNCRPFSPLVAIAVSAVLLAGCFGFPSSPPPAPPAIAPCAPGPAIQAPYSATLGHAEGSSFNLTDGQGTRATIRSPVRSIVSLVPSHTEVLFAIGAGGRVTGGTDYDTYPPEAANVTKVLVNLQVNFELVVSKTPDVVLVSSLNSAADIAHMRELNLTVFYADAFGVCDVPPMIELVGWAVEAPANATQVAATLRGDLNHTVEKVQATSSRPRTFYLLDDYGAWWTAGNGTRGNDLLRLSGGTNVFANASGWTSVSLEAIVVADPEVIILGLYVSLNQSAMNTTAPWSNMSAVKHGRVFRVPDADLVDRPGPRLGDGLEWLARAVHPEAL